MAPLTLLPVLAGEKMRRVTSSVTIDVTHHGSVDPSELVMPSRSVSGNADIPHKVVLPFGPQNAQDTVKNNGMSISPGMRAYLEIAAQNQVGPKYRTERVAPTVAWDASMLLNPDAV